MAINTKGIQIRLGTTNATAASSVISITTGGLRGVITSGNTAIIDFISLGFTSSMRLITNSSNNTGVLTINGASNANLVLNSTTLINADPSTNLSIIGYQMDNIGEVVSIDGPAGSVNVIDITNLGSTAREKLVGIQDEGQLSMEVLSNFTTGSTGINQWKLRDLRQAGTKGVFDLVLTDQSATLPTPSAYFFEGFVTNYANAVALDDAVKASVGLEISSQAHFINRAS